MLRGVGAALRDNFDVSNWQRCKLHALEIQRHRSTVQSVNVHVTDKFNDRILTCMFDASMIDAVLIHVILRVFR